MDANGLRFWMLCDRQHWDLGESPALEYHGGRRVLRLASRTTDLGGSDVPDEQLRTQAEQRLDRTPATRDAHGTRAFWSPAERAIVATGAAPGDVVLHSLAPGSAPTDLACGYDGVLYITVDGNVTMRDLRARWPVTSVEQDGLNAWRLAAAPSGGVWVLDRDSQRVWRLHGSPLPPSPGVRAPEETFEACEANPDPPRFSPVTEAGWLAAEERAVGIAASPAGVVAILLWDAAGAGWVALLEAGRPPRRLPLSGGRFPYSIAWLGESRLAVMTPALPTAAAVFDLTSAEADDTLDPAGEFYPLLNHDGGPFLHGLDLPPHYPTSDARGHTPLHALSRPRYTLRGEATLSDPRFIDSGSAQTVWHRLYLEASIPDDTAVKVYLAASEQPVAPPLDQPGAWHEHHFGESTSAGLGERVPRGAWVSYPSEVPFQPGFLDCPPEPQKSGLFTALVQRTGRAVSTVRGRYLHVRLELIGNGRSTPEVAALRVYGPRFSYIENYLPEIYKEPLTGADADAVSERGSRHDFLERFVGNFEGTLTAIEDRIANAHLLTDARTAPVEALEWLGSWIGVSFDPAYPADRRRSLLRSAPELYRRRGTLEGLRQALDVATGGGCSRGDIVVVEDYRLRRTFATILGADFADEDDPLLAGIVRSGNSVVGDTLFLGNETRREFLALFNADVARDVAEEAAIEAFLESLAFQVTVLVHQNVRRQDLGLIERIVELETPAHVLCRVVTTSRPLLVGVASLVGVDTYLEDEDEPSPVRLGSSALGVSDVILRPPSLDPRLEGASMPAGPAEWRLPVADAGPTLLVQPGESFTLDASRSRPGSGGEIVRYVWMLVT